MRPRTILGGVAAILMATALTAEAGPNPCCDWFDTPVLAAAPNTGTSIDFSPSPIPADFFGPGSDPFDGTIYLSGEPIDIASTGDADTRVQRPVTPFQPSDPPSPTPVQVDIEIVELSLVSTQPITVTFNGGQDPTQWDVRVTVTEPQAPGQLQATKTHDNGGTFNALLPVQPALTFTRIDIPTQQQVLVLPQPYVLQFQDVPWVHVASPLLHVYVPDGALFVPGVEETTPGDPTSQQRVNTTGQSIPQPGQPNAEQTISAPLLATATPGLALPGWIALGLVLLGGGIFALSRAFRKDSAATA